MLSRSLALALKESRELLRDPIYLGLAFFVPMMLLQLFGYGLSLDVKNLPVVFVDYDNNIISRSYIDSFVHSEYFDLIGVTHDVDEARELMQKGSARVIIELPTNFARELTSAHQVPVSITVDGSFPNRAEVILSYITVINAMNNMRFWQDFAQQQGIDIESVLPINLHISIWYNPSLESIHMIVPGLLVLILMLFPAILGALVIVREKEEGTIFNLYCSPIYRWEIIAGKASPYILVAFIDYLLIFVVSIFQFKVLFVGSFLVLSVAAFLYCICTVGIGLLFSIITRTQLAAMLLTFLLTITPAFNYSGFTTPVASMDAVGQFIAHLVPATYFMEIVRGSYLKGLGLSHYAGDLVAMTIYTVIVYLLCWLLLRKRIG
ncbi:MAG: ABC transporter permease [Pseudomonadales bacterium]|nr:ABC transporter permease [Pseudomonadales bacterium]